MTTYRIGSILVHPEQPDFDTILEAAYKGKLQPFCMCKGEPGLPMHIAHINGGYWIRRNPRTGKQHEVRCGSWEIPDEFSGRADVFGSGISYDGEKALLRLAFPLAKQGNRIAPPMNAGGNEDKLSVSNGGKRLSLQGLLHALWDEAGLASWQGGEPERKWEYVHESLMMSTDDKVVKQHPLSHFIFIPEPWERERAEEQEASRRKRLIEFAVQQGKKGHQLMLLIGELKKIESSSSGGIRFVVRHVPGFSFSGNEKLKERIEKHYSKEAIVVRATEEKWSHQIVAATFSVLPEGTAEIEEICYMPVNSQWIPFDNIYEHDLIAKLIGTKRSFIRPLRYNRLKTSVMSTVVLTDTESGPTALYIIPPDQDSDRVRNASLEVDYHKWFWDTKESNEIPEIPARHEGAEEAIGYLSKVPGNSHAPTTRADTRPPVGLVPAPPPSHPFIRSLASTASSVHPPSSTQHASAPSTVSTIVQGGPESTSPQASSAPKAQPIVSKPIPAETPHSGQEKTQITVEHPGPQQGGVSSPAPIPIASVSRTEQDVHSNLAQQSRVAAAPTPSVRQANPIQTTVPAKLMTSPPTASGRALPLSPSFVSKPEPTSTSQTAGPQAQAGSRPLAPSGTGTPRSVPAGVPTSSSSASHVKSVTGARAMNGLLSRLQTPQVSRPVMQQSRPSNRAAVPTGSTPSTPGTIAQNAGAFTVSAAPTAKPASAAEIQTETPEGRQQGSNSSAA